MNETQPQEKPSINAPTDKEYIDIIESEVIVDPQYTKEEGQVAKIVYYCKECKKPVAPKRLGKKLSFKCSECDSSPIAFGTESSIANYYNAK